MATTAVSTKRGQSAKKQSRAVVRRIEAGNAAVCVECSQSVKFAARIIRFQVICNVYVKGRWDRVEHFHEACYQAAGQPHGSPLEGQPDRMPSSIAARSA